MKKTLFFLSLFLGLSLLAEAQTSHPPVNGSISIPSNSSTARQAVTNLPSQTCSFVAPLSNTGCVYLGGYTVTNSTGSNPGISIGGVGCEVPAWSNVTVNPNANAVYFSTDTNGNVVKWLCN